MNSRSKGKKLYSLAAQDAIYNVWKNCYEDCNQPFQAYVNKQPEEIQNILRGYADCGRMMMQRIINIACDNMEFIENGEEL